LACNVARKPQKSYNQATLWLSPKSAPRLQSDTASLLYTDPLPCLCTGAPVRARRNSCLHTGALDRRPLAHYPSNTPSNTPNVCGGREAPTSPISLQPKNDLDRSRVQPLPDSEAGGSYYLCKALECCFHQHSMNQWGRGSLMRCLIQQGSTSPSQLQPPCDHNLKIT